MRIAILAAAAFMSLTVAAPARAELEKTASLDCQGICLHVWPKIVVPDGWQQDVQFSNAKNINFIYPANDPNNVGIYAGARDKDGQADTVDGFRADDKAGFLKRNPGMQVNDGPVFTTADGQQLKSLDFVPSGDENWDTTFYGAETDADGHAWYLTFTISAPTKAQHDQYLPVLKQIIAAYHK